MAATTLASAPDAAVASRRWDATIPANLLRTVDPQALFRELTASWHPSSTVVNRRDSHRIPCEIEAVLLPIDDRDQAIRSDVLAVLIANLSKCGVGIVHRQPLPHRLALIEYDLTSGILVRLLVQLKWCRFKGADVYESGGQILRVLHEATPVGQARERVGSRLDTNPGASEDGVNARSCGLTSTLRRSVSRRPIAGPA